MSVDEHKNFQIMDLETTIEELKSNLNFGLKNDDVQDRYIKYGYNEVLEKKKSPIIRFLKRFWGLTAWMLEFIIILSIILSKYANVIIISVLLVLNAILGFFEEQKATNIVEKLKNQLHIDARVLRDGNWVEVPSRELVPGDIVRVRAGDIVPADLKIIEGELMVDQSALTGESMQVEKKERDIIFAGSIIKFGESTSIVILTGTKTYFGRTTELVQMARPKLHIEEIISKVVKWLLYLVISLLAVAIVFTIIRNIRIWDILPLLLILLLSAIPVALPAMFTISMAIGTMELSKKGVLITNLSASEDVATMNILCSDKTGTITENKLSIINIDPKNGFTKNDVIFYGALASQEANRDPMDLAFINSAADRGLGIEQCQQEKFVPFDPKRRRTKALIQICENNNRSDSSQSNIPEGDIKFTAWKGAINEMAEVCGLTSDEIHDIDNSITEFTSKGYKTLAVATNRAPYFNPTEKKADNFESDKITNGKRAALVGIVALYDTIRSDSKSTIKELQDLGISVKMLTGDALPIAKEIAKNVGLGENVVRISELKEKFEKDPAEAARIAKNTDVFAEIYPEDKFLIVKTLQGHGNIVGMTGDGVNDAPALRQSEVGIAVSNATDVAKGAASVVLTREGLSDVVDLVKMGRRIYQRITTWILNKIMRTFLKNTLIVFSFLILGQYIITAFAMVLILLLNDFMKISISTDNVTWSQEPDTWDLSGLVKVALILGVATLLEVGGMLYIGIRFFGILSNIDVLQSYSFAILLFPAVFSIFNIRERKHFWKSKPSKFLFYSMVADLALGSILLAIGIPNLAKLPLHVIGFLIVFSFVFILIVNNFVKFLILKWIPGNW